MTEDREQIKQLAKIFLADRRRQEREERAALKRAQKIAERGEPVHSEAWYRAADLGCSLAVARYIIEAENRKAPRYGKRVDSSLEATERRQQVLVEYLTNGQRVSLNRAKKLARFSGRHCYSMDQILGSPAIMALFREAVMQGRPLPAKYAEKIMTAIGVDPVAHEAYLQELRDLGILDPLPEAPAPPPPPEPPPPYERHLGWSTD